MRWFLDLKIKVKILVSFGVMIGLMLALFFYAISQTLYISSRYYNILNYPVEASISMLRAQSAMRAFRRTAASMVAHTPAGNTTAIQALTREGLTFFDSAMQWFDNFEHIVANNEKLTQIERDRSLERVSELRFLLRQFHDNIFIPISEASLAGDYDSAISLVLEGQHIIERLVVLSDVVIETTYDIRVTHTRYTHEIAYAVISLLIAVGTIVFLVVAFLALFVANATSKQVKSLTQITASVTGGNLDISMNVCGSTKDEVGELSAYIANMVHTFKWLIEEINNVSYEVEKGNIDSYVNTSHFVGAYAEAAAAVNTLLDKVKLVDIAEANSQAKSLFLARMSHEIRSPMNVILGITEIQLQKATLYSEIREAFEKIYISGDILLSIINDILDLSKIEEGKINLIIEKYEIASMINDILILNMMRIESSPIKFEVSIDDTMPACMLGDELRIKQILNNILSNAFKYTEKGTIKLSMSAKAHEQTPDQTILVITISDTGPGMSKEQISRLFEAYVRFNTGANRYTEGAGLGMNIANNLVSLMQGEILVESEVGKGSTFTVCLPQGIVSDRQLGKETADVLAKFRMSRHVQKGLGQIMQEPMPYGKVLVVDDVDINIYVAKGLLMPYKLQIDSANSGFAAIEKIESGAEYDIVFMDHMMPQMDGIETTTHLRNKGYTRPIVALTANAIVGQAGVFLKNGFDDFISKPIDVRRLNAVLRKFIRDKQTPEVLEEVRRQASADIVKNKSLDIENHLKSSEINDLVCRDLWYRQKNIIPDLMRAIEEGDLKTAHFLVHTLKGLAALIGENVLASLAEDAEAAFHKGVVPAGGQIDSLVAEVERVLGDIEQHRINETDLPPAKNPALDKDKAREVFDKLVPLLSENSFNAVELIGELSEIPNTGEIIHQIQTIDFALALKTIADFRERMEV